VRHLVDTHLLLWAASEPERLSAAARAILTDEKSQLWFSVASIWEVVIKASLGRTDFDVDAHLLRRGLLESDFAELSITGPHVMAVADLPPLHRDPFDRILLAQARTEGLILVTGDAALARYPGDIEVV
jgi:PIN domain nuclease of toxin-antitoxin system